jgi:hypothetical protein
MASVDLAARFVETFAVPAPGSVIHGESVDSSRCCCGLTAFLENVTDDEWEPGGGNVSPGKKKSSEWLAVITACMIVYVNQGRTWSFVSPVLRRSLVGGKARELAGCKFDRLQKLCRMVDDAAAALFYGGYANE